MTGIETTNWRAALLRACVSPSWSVYGSFRLSAAWPAHRLQKGRKKIVSGAIQTSWWRVVWPITFVGGYRTCKHSCSQAKQSQSQTGSDPSKPCELIDNTVQIDRRNRVSARALDLNTNYAIHHSFNYVRRVELWHTAHQLPEIIQIKVYRVIPRISCRRRKKGPNK